MRELGGGNSKRVRGKTSERQKGHFWIEIWEENIEHRLRIQKMKEKGLKEINKRVSLFPLAPQVHNHNTLKWLISLWVLWCRRLAPQAAKIKQLILVIHVCILRCTPDVSCFLFATTCFQFMVYSENLILEDCISLNAYCVDLTRKLFRIKFLNSFIHHLFSVVKSLLCVRLGCAPHAQRSIRIHIRQQINQNVYHSLAGSSSWDQASRPK